MRKLVFLHKNEITSKLANNTENHTRQSYKNWNSEDTYLPLLGLYPDCGYTVDWLVGWLGFNGILSTQVAAISCLRKFKVC